MSATKPDDLSSLHRNCRVEGKTQLQSWSSELQMYTHTRTHKHNKGCTGLKKSVSGLCLSGLVCLDYYRAPFLPSIASSGSCRVESSTGASVTLSVGRKGLHRLASHHHFFDRLYYSAHPPASGPLFWLFSLSELLPCRYSHGTLPHQLQQDSLLSPAFSDHSTKY